MHVHDMKGDAVFVISTPEWPTRVVVLRPTYDGARDAEFEIVQGEHPRPNVARECEQCGIKLLPGAVYRSISGLWMWHPACFLEELRKRCSPTQLVGRWKLHTIEWNTITDTTIDE